MAETLHHSSDVPNFDTYPSSPSNYPPSRPRFPAANHLPDNPGSPALEQRARQIGAAMGTAIGILRKARALGSETTESAVTRLGDLAETARVKAHEFGQAASARALELGEAVAEKAEELGERAKAGYDQARRRADRISREHPEHVLIGALALGILLGVGMRIWRSNRAS